MCVYLYFSVAFPHIALNYTSTYQITSCHVELISPVFKLINNTWTWTLKKNTETFQLSQASPHKSIFQPFTHLLTRYHLQTFSIFLNIIYPHLHLDFSRSSHRHLCLQILPRAFNEAFGHGRHGLRTHLRTAANRHGPLRAVAAGCHEMLVLREAQLQLGFGLPRFSRRSQIWSQIFQDLFLGGKIEKLAIPNFWVLS